MANFYLPLYDADILPDLGRLTALVRQELEGMMTPTITKQPKTSTVERKQRAKSVSPGVYGKRTGDLLKSLKLIVKGSTIEVSAEWYGRFHQRTLLPLSRVNKAVDRAIKKYMG